MSIICCDRTTKCLLISLNSSLEIPLYSVRDFPQSTRSQGRVVKTEDSTYWWCSRWWLNNGERFLVTILVFISWRRQFSIRILGVIMLSSALFSVLFAVPMSWYVYMQVDISCFPVRSYTVAVAIVSGIVLRDRCLGCSFCVFLARKKFASSSWTNKYSSVINVIKD